MMLETCSKPGGVGFMWENLSVGSQPGLADRREDLREGREMRTTHRRGARALAVRYANDAANQAGPRRLVAKALGVGSDNSLSHLLTDRADSFYVAQFYQLVLTGDPTIVAPFVEGMVRVQETRALLESDPVRLQVEGDVLLEREAAWDGEEDHVTLDYFRGLCSGEDFSRAHRKISNVSGRLADIRDILWEAHRIEMRDVLAKAEGGAS